MSVMYRIYSGDHSGGPVDYTAVIGVTGSLFFSPPALPLNSTTTFAVRAYDPVTGLDDANVDAYVTIIVDGSGNDVTNRPHPPSSLRALATSTGATAEWTYPHLDPVTKPTGFHVYVGSPSVSYGSPAATTAWSSGRGGRFRATLSGLTPGTTYKVGVRAYNASGEEPNTTAVTVTLPASPPGNVSGLSGSPGY